ncbi:MAG: phage virion morphogenesis protein [Zoogloea sp.]|nr:phage virion morphogenesis protein [Zoogloea sp.]
MSIKIEVTSREVLDVLSQYLELAENPRKVMDAIGATLDNQVSNRFETETDPDGVPWAPWMQSTVDSYPREGFKAGNGTVLDRYGDLLDHRGWSVDDTSVTYGLTEIYGAFHEFGTKDMVRRGILMSDPDTGELGSADQEAILATIYDNLGFLME